MRVGQGVVRRSFDHPAARSRRWMRSPWSRLPASSGSSSPRRTPSRAYRTRVATQAGQSAVQGAVVRTGRCRRVRGHDGGGGRQHRGVVRSAPAGRPRSARGCATPAVRRSDTLRDTLAVPSCPPDSPARREIGAQGWPVKRACSPARAPAPPLTPRRRRARPCTRTAAPHRAPPARGRRRRRGGRGCGRRDGG